MGAPLMWPSAREAGRTTAGRTTDSQGTNGWEAGTRTPIRRSRVCSLTIRRPPRLCFILSSARAAAAETPLDRALDTMSLLAIDCNTTYGYKTLGPRVEEG